MKRNFLTLLGCATLCVAGVSAQTTSKAYVAPLEKSHIKAEGLDMGSVQWTNGFWKERFDLVMPNLIPSQYEFFMGFAENNFRILNGEKVDQDGFKGTYWQDGDYFKWLEAQISVYSVTKDAELLKKIEELATIVANSVADDGYSTTHTQIGYGVTGSERAWDKPFKNDVRFFNRNRHETYNMGHFLTLAATHYRVTGSRTLLDKAILMGDYLDKYFAKMTPELSAIDFNPTQIMGVMELYRCTGEKRYLELANRFITGRGNRRGTTQNQDDTKLRDEYRAVGHAVLGPVLYIGAADYAAESGDAELKAALERIWTDMYTRKASFTEGLGNVHRGGSETPRNATECVHEAFGKPYHLQSATAYNETCATFYGAYFNWRMFMLTGESKYLDHLESAFYNNLSSMGLDGKSYYYTNVLRWYGKEHNCLSLDFHQRWTEECTCVCCPTSLARFLSQTKEYAYAQDANSLYVILYGSNNVNAKIAGKNVTFTQKSDYPWSESIEMNYEGDNKAQFSLKLRIPAWAEGATLKVNGENYGIKAGGFAVVNRAWKRGDKVEMTLPMRPIINEANPMVEEVRNQVAISYGPMAYCVEGVDLPKGVKIEQLILPVDSKFDVKYEQNLLGGVKTISTKALKRNSTYDPTSLYRPIAEGYSPVSIKFVPYYAWSNRGESEMSVFLPIKW